MLNIRLESMIVLSPLQHTGLITAAHRAHSKKVRDYLGGKLAGKEVMNKTRNAKHGTQFVEDRTLWFDDKINKSDSKSIVMFGAGMDTRAYRLPSLCNKKVYETDFPNVIAYKKFMLQEEQPNCPIEWFEYDIYSDDLSEYTYHFPEPLYIAEGFLYYIKPYATRKFFESIPQGSTVLFDAISNNLDVANKLFSNVTNTPFLWGEDNPTEYLENMGFIVNACYEYQRDEHQLNSQNVKLFMISATKKELV